MENCVKIVLIYLKFYIYSKDLVKMIIAFRIKSLYKTFVDIGKKSVYMSQLDSCWFSSSSVEVDIDPQPLHGLFHMALVLPVL